MLHKKGVHWWKKTDKKKTSFQTHVLHHNKRLQIIINITGRWLIFKSMQSTRIWMLENLTNKTPQTIRVDANCLSKKQKQKKRIGVERERGLLCWRKLYHDIFCKRDRQVRHGRMLYANIAEDQVSEVPAICPVMTRSSRWSHDRSLEACSRSLDDLSHKRWKGEICESRTFFQIWSDTRIYPTKPNVNVYTRVKHPTSGFKHSHKISRKDWKKLLLDESSRNCIYLEASFLSDCPVGNTYLKEVAWLVNLDLCTLGRQSQNAQKNKNTHKNVYLCLEPCSWLWRCPLVREPDLLRCLLLLSLERERERRLSRDVERERLLRRSRERDLRERGCQLLVQWLIMTNSRRMRLSPFMFPAAWSGSMWKRSRRIDILQCIYTLKHVYTLKHLTTVLTSSSFFPPSPFLLFFLSAPGFFSPACRQQLSAQKKKKWYYVYNSCNFLSFLPKMIW